jgi:hypothetical protein
VAPRLDLHQAAQLALRSPRCEGVRHASIHTANAISSLTNTDTGDSTLWEFDGIVLRCLAGDNTPFGIVLIDDGVHPYDANLLSLETSHPFGPCVDTAMPDHSQLLSGLKAISTPDAQHNTLVRCFDDLPAHQELVSDPELFGGLHCPRANDAKKDHEEDAENRFAAKGTHGRSPSVDVMI